MSEADNPAPVTGSAATSSCRFVPIMHAKLALLEHLQRHDEDAFGNPDDIIWFTP